MEKEKNIKLRTKKQAEPFRRILFNETPIIRDRRAQLFQKDMYIPIKQNLKSRKILFNQTLPANSAVDNLEENTEENLTNTHQDIDLSKGSESEGPSAEKKKSLKVSKKYRCAPLPQIDKNNDLSQDFDNSFE